MKGFVLFYLEEVGELGEKEKKNKVQEPEQLQYLSSAPKLILKLLLAL